MLGKKIKDADSFIRLLADVVTKTNSDRLSLIYLVVLFRKGEAGEEFIETLLSKAIADVNLKGFREAESINDKAIAILGEVAFRKECNICTNYYFIKEEGHCEHKEDCFGKWVEFKPNNSWQIAAVEALEESDGTVYM